MNGCHEVNADACTNARAFTGVDFLSHEYGDSKIALRLISSDVVTFTFQVGERRQWRRNGVLTMIERVAEELQVAEDYLLGIENAVNAMHYAVQVQSDRAARERRRLEEESERMRRRDSKPMRLSRKVRDAAVLACNGRCEAHGRPSPPMPDPGVTAEDVGENNELDGVAAIYFAWESDVVVYVGQTTNLRSRMRSHHKVKPTHKLSWIELNRSDLSFEECFYIWACRPVLNGTGDGNRA